MSAASADAPGQMPFILDSTTLFSRGSEGSSIGEGGILTSYKEGLISFSIC